MRTRAQQLDHLEQYPDIPVLIVGGGVNGAGLFRDLALQGVAARLVEKSDFAAGASSASSRMIHGGLRYLENRETRLVKESLAERNLLLANAPHYVKPLPTTIPVFSWTSGFFSAIPRFFGVRTRPSNRGAILVKLGLSMYDFFTRHARAMPAHTFQRRAAALKKRPALDPHIVCTATYYDAWISFPERLVVELILDGEAACDQADALNYCAVTGIEGGEVTLRDEVSGRTIRVRPRVVVNATGAWIDLTNRRLLRRSSLIGGTKGSHLVVDHPELMASLQGQMIYYENKDGRICIMFPLHGRVLVGSTDIPVTDPETAVCDAGEERYLIESVTQVFPSIRIARDQVLYRFCGVRPLPNEAAGTPGQISRDHRLDLIPPDAQRPFPIYSMIGGKWTAFRAFAAQAADAVLGALGGLRKLSTENLAIGGGRDFPRSEAARRTWLSRFPAGATRIQASVLLDRYGTRAEFYLAQMAASPDKPLEQAPAYTENEIVCLLREEKAVHLDDLVLRRTVFALTGRLDAALLDALSRIMAREKAWTEARRLEEIARTRGLLWEKHDVAPEG